MNAGKALEISLYVLGGLLEADSKLARQPLRTHPVDDSEVDHLGESSRLCVHLFGSSPQHLGGGAGVDVLAAAKGVDEGRVARKMGQHAQLYLRVIGRQH